MNIFKYLFLNCILTDSSDSAAELWPVRGYFSISPVFSGTFSYEFSINSAHFLCSLRTLRCAQNIKQFFLFLPQKDNLVMDCTIE